MKKFISWFFFVILGPLFFLTLKDSIHFFNRGQNFILFDLINILVSGIAFIGLFIFNFKREILLKKPFKLFYVFQTIWIPIWIIIYFIPSRGTMKALGTGLNLFYLLCCLVPVGIWMFRDYLNNKNTNN